MSEIRMDAYYYSFNKTNVDCVDELLSSIACAGKAFHHTSQWTDETTAYEEHTIGETPIDWIQNSAIKVANEITRLNNIIKEMQQIDDVLAPQKWISVDDAMPKQGLTVLVLLNEQNLGITASLPMDATVDLSWTRNNGMWVCSQGVYKHENITHWKPLPPKP